MLHKTRIIQRVVKNEIFLLFLQNYQTKLNHSKKKAGCFDSIWLPQFHTSSASLNTVETHCLLYIPNSD